MSDSARVVLELDEETEKFHYEFSGNFIGQTYCFARGMAARLHQSSLSKAEKMAVIMAVFEQTKEDLAEMEAANNE